MKDSEASAGSSFGSQLAALVIPIALQNLINAAVGAADVK
jgi:hypothetical protein